MAKNITTESVESKTRVFLDYDAYDFMAIAFYMFLAYGLRTYVHPFFRAIYFIFSFLAITFLVTKSAYNKKRKNFESIYFLITRDIATYRPYQRKERTDG